MELLAVLVGVLVVALVVAVVLVRAPSRRRRATRGAPPARPSAPPRPLEKPKADPDAVRDILAPRTIAPPTEREVAEPEVVEPEVVEPAAPELEVPEPTSARMVRLRSRLARSQSTLGKGLLALLSSGDIDEDTWDDVETTLLSADVGVAAAAEIVESLKTRVKVLGSASEDQMRALLRDELVAAIGASDRTIRALPADGKPAVLLVVGVNGTGKTTTCGKLARVLVADGRSVVLGAADTFRAAAADQLTTWAGRVGAEVVRGAEGADPASVAFDAVKEGVDRAADSVIIDTAGRLHTKTGLMDELTKIKRVAERLGRIDEVLLVLDATTGQNGVVQARQFAEAVGITGIVLTKLDGTAKGGIVIAVQRDLGIPVKLIGLGEGPDDLAPFTPESFVDALLADT